MMDAEAANATAQAGAGGDRSGGRTLTGTYAGPAGTRPYSLFVPNRADRPLPLLVLLHGCGQSPADLAAATGMDARAAEGPFLVLYPEQARRANRLGCWNWWRPENQRRGSGEPALIAGLTREILARYPVDPRRVYVAGVSAGGALAATLAATYPDLYAAAGVHSGLAYGAAHSLASAWIAMRHGSPGTLLPAAQAADDEAAAGYVPLIVVHGDADRVVRARNADALIRQWTDAYETLTGRRTHAVEHHGRVPGGHPYTRRVYLDSGGQPPAEAWLVHGGAHAWMGGRPGHAFSDPAGPDAAGAMLDFFRTHPREPAR